MVDEAFEAGEVKLVVEVLSPSTREFNLFGKQEEYKSLPSMRYVLLIEPNAPEVILWSRSSGTTWAHATFEGLDASIPLGDLNVNLALSDIYDDLTFRSSPRLVTGDS